MVLRVSNPQDGLKVEPIPGRARVSGCAAGLASIADGTPTTLVGLLEGFGGRVHARRLREVFDYLGVWIGTEAPPDPIAPASWARGVVGHWLWITADMAIGVPLDLRAAAVAPSYRLSLAAAALDLAPRIVEPDDPIVVGQVPNLPIPFSLASSSFNLSLAVAAIDLAARMTVAGRTVTLSSTSPSLPIPLSPTSPAYRLALAASSVAAPVVVSVPSSVIQSYVLQDANTVALWKFETGHAVGDTLVDEVGNLPLVIGGVGGNARDGDTVAARSGNGLQTVAQLGGGGGDQTYGVSANLNSTFATLLRTGSWTMEGWIKLPSNPDALGASGWIWQFAADPGSAWYLQYASIGMTFPAAGPTDQLKIFFNTANDWSGGFAITSVANTLMLGAWNHFAVRRQSVGGGLYRNELFFNGASIGSGNCAANPLDPSTAIKTQILGAGTNGGGGLYSCIVDTFRLSNKYRSDVEIADFYANT